MNLRPSGYEPDELPGCSTPRAVGPRTVGGRGAGSESCGPRGRCPGLATTRSPTLRRAVPWARRGFTAEFGMGSGGARALWSPSRDNGPEGRGQRSEIEIRPAGGGPSSAILGLSWSREAWAWVPRSDLSDRIRRRSRPARAASVLISVLCSLISGAKPKRVWAGYRPSAYLSPSDGPRPGAGQSGQGHPRPPGRRRPRAAPARPAR